MKAKYCPSTQKQNNQKYADQEDQLKKAAEIQDAIDRGASALPSTYASNLKVLHWNWSSDSATQNHSIDFDQPDLSFDVDVTGLKTGDKVYVGDIVTSSSDNLWAQNNDLMTLNGRPVIINGTLYGYLQMGNWGNGQAGGDQNTIDGSSLNPAKGQYKDPEHRDHHQIYFVLTKDMNGIGTQHITVQGQNRVGMHYINMDLGPNYFEGKSSVTGTISVINHEGRTIWSKVLTFTKPTDPHVAGTWNGQNMGGVTSPTNANGSYWTGDAALLGKDKAPVRITDHIVNQNNYKIATEFSATNEGLPLNTYQDENGKPSGSIELSWDVFNSNGDAVSLEGGAVQRVMSTSNLQSNTVPVVIETPDLSIAELNKLVNNNQSAEYISYRSDRHGYNSILNLTKSWLQERVKKVMTNKDTLMRLPGAWAIANDSNPDKAAQNTMDFYKNNDYLPTGYYVGSAGDFEFVDPYAKGTVTSHSYSLDLNSPVQYDQTLTVPKGTPDDLKSGQSGIRVHYINGATGQDMRTISTSVGDPNTFTSIVPQLIKGYLLTADGAKGLPAGAEVFEKAGTTAYPSDGTWKNVYIVYSPYGPSQINTTIHYHYDVFGICGRHEQWPSFKFNFAT